MAEFERYARLHRVILVWDEMTGALKGAAREEFRAFRDIETGEMQAAGITEPVPLLADDLAGILAPAEATLYSQLSASLAEVIHLRAVNQRLRDDLDALLAPGAT